MKTQFPLFLCLVAGLLMAVQYFVPALLPIYNRVNDYIQVVTAFSLVLGVASLVHRHVEPDDRAVRRTRLVPVLLARRRVDRHRPEPEVLGVVGRLHVGQPAGEQDRIDPQPDADGDVQ